MAELLRASEAARSRRLFAIVASSALALIATGACGSTDNNGLFDAPDAGAACDPALQACQCFTSAECGGSAECIRNQCVGFTACASRTECGAQVCDVGLGRCVECLAATDCASGEVCASRRCRVACQSDLECRSAGMLCDRAAGHCAACASDSPCPAGQTCIGGDCVAQVCEPGTRVCANDAIVTCAADGSAFGEPRACPNGCVVEGGGPRCASASDGSAGTGGSGGASGSGGDGGNSGGGSGGSGGSGGDAPTVVLLIDRSTSAEALLPDGVRTRWSMIQDGVIGAVRSAAQRSLHVSLGVYGYTGFVPPSGTQCPALEGLPPAPNNFAQVESYVSAMQMPAGKSETPTSAALDRLVELMAPIGGKRTIVLITDGIPDTCEQADQPCTDQAIAALQSAFRAGINTVMVGIGNELSEEILQDLANAGAGAPVQTPPPTRVACGPITPTYATAGGHAAYEHIVDNGLEDVLLRSVTTAAAP